MPERSPPVPGRAAWGQTVGQVAYWRPLIGRILRRHGLKGGGIRPGYPGTHAVFLIGGPLVVKVFAPYDFAPPWTEEWDEPQTEVGVHELLAREAEIPVPELVAHGLEGGWPYLVTRQIEGRPIREVLADMDRAAVESVVYRLGAIMRAIYALPVDAHPCRWRSFMSRQIRICAERQRTLRSLPEHLTAQIPDFLESAQPISTPGFEPRLIHADINADHVYVAPGGDGWRVTGLIDFGDAMIGEPEYDLVAPNLEITRGDPGLLRVLLGSTGLAFEPGVDLSRRLLAYTLLHLFLDLSAVSWWQNAGTPASLDELAARLWSIR